MLLVIRVMLRSQKKREEEKDLRRWNLPPFVPPVTPNVIFPFFEPNGESYLTMLGSDDMVYRINDITCPMWRQKYRPIIISTSRGMGKTFLLKMIGLIGQFDNVATFKRSSMNGKYLVFKIVRII